MGTQVFDDGSTLTTGPDGSITSTPAWDWAPSSYSDAFKLPEGSTNQLADLARLALGAYTANRQAAALQNATPTTARVPNPQAAMAPVAIGGGLVPLLIIGLVVFLAVRK
jgi:fatty acid desaturase